MSTDVVNPGIGWRAAVLGLGITALAEPVGAQAVRGQVVEAATGIAIGNGFVVLIDSAGRERARTLSDASGRFYLRAPGAGTYRLRSERIGFRVGLSEPLRVSATETRDHQLSISPIPVRLATIEVEREVRCTSRPGAGETTAALWEEARKALAAVAWSQEQELLQVRMQLFRRELTASLRVHQEQRHEVSGPASRPFRSPPAAELAQRGYVRATSDSGLVFYGPDAEVLFSDPFLNTHCFRPRAGTEANAGRVGLAFDPVQGRELPDIAGVIWLDTATAALRSVEFRYANFRVPGSTEAAGGSVEFDRLANGVWIVRRFAIRMPIVHQERRLLGGMTVERPEFYGYREDGGELIEVLDPGGGRLAARPRATLSGMIRDAGGTALPGATIRLEGTAYSATADRDGRFLLAGLPDGEYTVAFEYPRFPMLGWISGPDIALSAGDSRIAALTIPPFRLLYDRFCGEPDSIPTGAVVGIVRDSLDRAIPRARVHAGWSNWDLSGVRAAQQLRAAARLLDRRETVTTVGDSSGYFRFCNLPADKLVEVWIETSEGRKGSSARVYPIRDSIVEQVLSTRPTTTRASLTIRGTVVDAVSGSPIEGAVASFAGMATSGRRTNHGGEFQLVGPPAARSMLSANDNVP